MGTTDRRGCLVSKHLEILKFSTEIDSLNSATDTQDGPSWARRTVAGSRFKTLRKTENWVLKIDSLNFVTKWQDGPSQAIHPKSSF